MSEPATMECNPHLRCTASQMQTTPSRYTPRLEPTTSIGHLVLEIKPRGSGDENVNLAPFQVVFKRVVKTRWPFGGTFCIRELILGALGLFFVRVSSNLPENEFKYFPLPHKGLLEPCFTVCSQTSSYHPDYFLTQTPTTRLDTNSDKKRFLPFNFNATKTYKCYPITTTYTSLFFFIQRKIIS